MKQKKRKQNAKKSKIRTYHLIQNKLLQIETGSAKKLIWSKKANQNREEAKQRETKQKCEAKQVKKSKTSKNSKKCIKNDTILLLYAADPVSLACETFLRNRDTLVMTFCPIPAGLAVATLSQIIPFCAYI